MRTIYIYLSWTGWIWSGFVATYLFVQLRKRRIIERSGFPVTVIPDKIVGVKSTEVAESNE